MKKLFLSASLGFLLSASQLFAVNVNAAFTYGVFQSPQQGPYVETWLSVNASTVNFVKLPGGSFKGEVEVLLLFNKGTEVAAFRKYNLSSQEVADTAARNFSFLDQQRFLLAEGEYSLEISLRDVNSTNAAVESKTQVTVIAPSDKVCLSSIQLIERSEPAAEPSLLTRAGYNLFPDFNAFYPESKTHITFYSEVYHTSTFLGDDGMFLISAFIESFETSRVMSNISFYKREKAGGVIPFLHSFDISNLPSGNYNVVIEVRDKENQVIASNETFFQRSNPSVKMELEDISAIQVAETFTAAYTQIDTLALYIRSCMPVASDMEKTFADNLLKERDLNHMQQFLYHFWFIRDGGNPERAWLNYKVQVDRVNISYTTFIKKGFETDRGIIFLKYGVPNTIYKSTHEPEAYPYEIWHYYKLTSTQSNRKFVFISTDLGVSDYDLAHSNATGEMSDPQWHLKLHARHVGGTDIDRTDYDTNYGSRALELFNNPY